jgi:tetratricopeptide (TPR) repeat protein
MHLRPTGGELGDYLERRTRAHNERGLERLREAWRNGKPYQVSLQLFFLNMQSLSEGWAVSPADTLAEMSDVSETMLSQRPNWGASHVMLGFLSILTGDGARGVQAFERAVEMQGAAFPAMHAFLGAALVRTDRPEEALAAIAEAVRLSPDDPLRFAWEVTRGSAHFAAGRYPEARDAARLALSFNTNDSSNNRANAYQLLAASLALLGETTEARAQLAEAVRLRPALNLELAAVWFASSSAEHRERYLEGLRLAGLGERGVEEGGAGSP